MTLKFVEAENYVSSEDQGHFSALAKGHLQTKNENLHFSENNTNINYFNLD